jgi:hypothetical protein
MSKDKKKRREPRHLSKEEVQTLIILPQQEVTLAWVRGVLASTSQREARYLPNDTLTLPKGSLPGTSGKLPASDLKTTVGRLIFNRAVVEPLGYDVLGYRNEPMGKPGISKLDRDVADLLLEGRVTAPQAIAHVDRLQWLGFSASAFVNPSLSPWLVVPLPEVEKRKKELVKIHEEAIQAGDVFKAGEIEAELLNLARGILKDDPSYAIYASESRGDFKNNYKNTAVMRGAMRSGVDGSYSVSSANLAEGIPRGEYDKYADMAVEASYGRAVQTRMGGYEAKKLSAAFQSVVLGEPSSDCLTRGLLTVDITRENAPGFKYRFVKEGNRLVELTPDVLQTYIGRSVQVRSPMFCRGEALCSRCSGTLYHRMGIRNVGLLSSRVGTRILNLALKAFHDSSVKTARLSVDRYVY